MFHRYNGKHAVARAVRALSMRARISIVTGTIAVFSVAGLVVSTTPASAASANVTVTVTNNQCPKGGNVARIWYSIDQGGVVNGVWSNTASTWSILGVRVYITGTAYCSTGWFSGYYYNFYNIPRYFWSSGYHTYI
jgi:hypothetical protein